MRDVRYLRAQAVLCLQIAQQMSNPIIAERLRANAASFQAQADAIDKPGAGPAPAMDCDPEPK